MLKSFDRLIARLATFNIVDSPSQQQFLIDEKVLCKKNSVVFGLGSVSGVDLKRFKSSKAVFNELRHTLGISEDAFVFTYLGRLNKDKGVLDLAKAFADINDNNAYLLIVGPDEGGFVDETKKINAHKLEQIRFIGFTSVPEQYLAASNALCLPSYREGFGSVIIEAAAMGLPAIASDIYGISDAIVNNETGLLHKPQNVNAIFDAMTMFLNNKQLSVKYGEAARSRVIESFDSKTISNYWLNFYLDHVVLTE
jgi:glycosyltransferase involved in cell wall biosynthesis